MPPRPGSAITEYATDIERDGFCVVPDVLDAATVEHFRQCLDGIEQTDAVRTRAGATYGVRDLLRQVPAVRDLANTPALRALVEPVLGSGAQIVRGIFFDKTPGANWSVPWHQDLTIAVQSQAELPGWGPWSVKAGIVHVQPPAPLLQEMLTLRVHLDETDEASGALKVVPGSHRAGRLGTGDIAAWKARGRVCPKVNAGGVLAMRPLLLHASAPATQPRHRRVVHLEYSASALPDGLEWHEG